MRMRIVVSLLAFLSLCGVAAQAQETPKVDVFAGYSYVRANPGPTSGDSFSLNGGEASVTYHFRDLVSGVADFAGYHNGNILGTGVDGTLSTYLFGPRISYRSYKHFTPFAEALFGVAHAGAGVAGGTIWKSACGSPGSKWPLASRHLSKNAAMSTVRSFTRVKLRSGSSCSLPSAATASLTRVRQVQRGRPFTTMAQEPHMPTRQAKRYDRVAS